MTDTEMRSSLSGSAPPPRPRRLGRAVSTLTILAALLSLTCRSSGSEDLGTYYKEVASVLEAFDMELKQVIEESAQLAGDEKTQTFAQSLDRLGERTAEELAAVRPPPVLLEVHATNLAPWRAGLFNPATAEYHCTGEHCYCFGDADCGRMFEEACGRPSPEDFCNETLGFPICKCDRFLCC